MKEKRRSHRIVIELPAFIRSADSLDRLPVASTLDISALGLCLTTKEKYSVGSELFIELRLPSHEKVLISTNVIWVKKTTFHGNEAFRMGVRIIDSMKAEEAKFIRFYARKLRSQAH